MQLSYSSLETYENCPLKYKFRHVEKTPAQVQPVPEREIGKNLHKALKEFYDHLDKMPATLDLLIQVYTAFWEGKGFANREEEQFYFKMGIKILEGFFAANAGKFTRPLTTERFFFLPFGEHTLTGIIDRVDQLADGTIEIIDYKTTKRLGTQQQLEQNDQMSIYSLAVEQLFGKKPDKLTLYYLRSNFPLSISRNDEQIERTKEKARRTIKKIEEKKFEPNYGPLCDYCEYQYVCFGHKDKNRAKNEVDNLTGVDIDQVVSEFVSLKAEVGEKQEKLDGLKDILKEYCEAHKVDRIYSNEVVVSRRKNQRFTFDAAKVKELLSPLGLYDEVTEVKAGKVEDLIEEGKVPAVTADELEKVKSLKSESSTISVSQIKPPSPEI